LCDIRRNIAVDLLAHGDTEVAPDQDLSVTANAKMLNQFLDALDIDCVDLVGNDSGGGIAQIFAALYPERLRSLTLTDCDAHDNWPPQSGMTPTRLALQAAYLYVAAFAFSMCTVLHGQAITGTWQGTLSAKETQRIVLKFPKAGNNGSLRGSLAFIDRGPSGIPLLSVTFVPPDLSVAVADISYRGKLSADAKSITGVWTQANQSYPLTLVLATPETLWTYSGPASIPPMAATAEPTLEVATIKPSQGNEKETSYGFKGLRFVASNSSVADLIKFAYRVRDRQIDGGPTWMNEDKFDIVAETDTPGRPSRDQQRSMVRKLLADRFGLKVQAVQRDFPVYALTLVEDPPHVSADESSGYDHGYVNVTDNKHGQTAVQFTHYTMPEFADALMNFIQDRQIVDETGLTGRFNFALMIPTDTAYGRQGPDEMDRSTAYFGAVQPLGFKLVRKRSPLEVIVINHLDKPSAN
jgi:uncharacterized protein (TIGR03435 family)